MQSVIQWIIEAKSITILPIWCASIPQSVSYRQSHRVSSTSFAHSLTPLLVAASWWTTDQYRMRYTTVWTDLPTDQQTCNGSLILIASPVLCHFWFLQFKYKEKRVWKKLGRRQICDWNLQTEWICSIVAPHQQRVWHIRPEQWHVKSTSKCNLTAFWQPEALHSGCKLVL